MIFFICAVLGALNTANAWRPFARDGALTLPIYLAGMLTSELPLQTVAWQVLATVGFALGGSFGSALGIAGLAISVLSWAGLVFLFRVAQASAGVLGVPAGMPLAALLLPTRGKRSKYCNDRDIAYGESGVRNQLDIWRRPDLAREGKAPVIVQIHGGAWTIGRKENDARPLMTLLAEQGWVCVAINYPLSPAATWPDHIVDIKRAIAWVKDNIAAYGGDPSFVAVTGGSSGGHLSALVGLTANDPQFQPGFEAADTSVAAAAPIYGLFDLSGTTGQTREQTMDFLAKKVFKSEHVADAARWEAGSPICRVHADAPPFLVVHGTNDSFLPVEQARDFVAALQKTSSAGVTFAELPRTQHGFDLFGSVRVHYLARAIARFLTSVHESHRTAVVIDPSG